MYSIENITIREYFGLADTSAYDIFIDSMNPINKFGDYTCNFGRLTYNEVQYVKNSYKKLDFNTLKDAILVCFNIRGTFERSQDKIFYDTSIFDLFRVRKLLEDFVKEKYAIEEKLLFQMPDDKMIMLDAGKRLQHVSFLLNKIDLAKRFSTTEREIGSWNYNRVLSILAAQNVQSTIRKEYSEMK